ncbi:MAG TPA: tetraacyldisaccharide 4'-kinase [Mucilaginibacter sp.]|jgi:tetraacyldisaccharide 4'-kinase|nr:tetraacyldisaccharide 4'-kinase [Mucilaginibacter sp.]
MKYLRWLLFPFSLLYGLVVIIRNWCYDAGVFKSRRFKIPVISVGNLEVGGAGKSPMTEYLIRLLKDQYKIATLSRGYGRTTKGFLVAGGVSSVKYQVSSTPSGDLQPATYNLQRTTAQLIGDEPAQFKHKFPDITVAVCEDRVKGIERLLPDHDIILMDDAYQHRAVEAGLSILLFDYNRLDDVHLLLPAGNMREPFSGRWRAQIIVISKCPAQLTADEQAAVAGKVDPLPYQQLFFTSIAYQGLQSVDGEATGLVIDKDTTVFLLTGIANAEPLVQHLSRSTNHIIHHKYPDHHPFTLKNIAKLAGEFAACASAKKIIVTTEKDAQRLDDSWFKPGAAGAEGLPVYVMPIRVEFLNESRHLFDQLITEYVREYRTDNSIH